MDIIIHFSTLDLQRNLGKYLDQTDGPLDRFAPGWRAAVDKGGSELRRRALIYEHWCSLVERTGMTVCRDDAQLVTGPGNQRLYWLVFAARHKKAREFWRAIKTVGKQRSLP